MDFKRNSEVVSSDGHKVGSLRRVVMDPGSKQIASLVIERGLLFTEDRLIPMDMVDRVEDDRVILKSGEDALKELNVFEETRYIPLNEDGERLDAYYWYPPVHGLTDSPYPLYPYPIYVESTRPNIPENYVALKEGAKVTTEDDESAGKLDSVLTDPKTDQITHLVVSSGMLGERKLLPAYWIKDVTEDEIHLSIEAGLIDKLEKYQEE